MNLDDGVKKIMKSLRMFWLKSSKGGMVYGIT